jgi:fermentation-respiration switch protein FrsA (DUF1100 family)
MYESGGSYEPLANYQDPRGQRGPASLAHSGVGASSVRTGEYVPGGVGGDEHPGWVAVPPVQEPERAPYFWELAWGKHTIPLWASAVRWFLVVALFAVSFFAFSYAGFSANAAANLASLPPTPLLSSPSDPTYKLDSKTVTFNSRGDHVLLSAWFIPGVGPHGTETDARTIIVVHSERENREDDSVGLLPLSAALAKAGFAVLAFDMRGAGLSQGEPLSMGYYEQRDVLGAVDYLQNGPLPYPKLGRPQAIGGLGFSMGAVSLLLAAAQTTAIQAVVSDGAYADAAPLMERDIPGEVGLPSWFTPGVFVAAKDMYGIDYTKIRPVDVVARIAPRPILFVQGASDTYIPSGDLNALTSAAQSGAGAQVSQWLVPDAKHDQTYKTAETDYVSKVVAFFTASLPTK